MPRAKPAAKKSQPKKPKRSIRSVRKAGQPDISSTARAAETRDLLEGLRALADLEGRPSLRTNQAVLNATKQSMLIKLSALHGIAPAAISAPQPSGVQWVKRFPDPKSLDVLADSFRPGAEAFVAAMQAAGANISVSSTRRPAERAYLMHWSWMIAREGVPPKDVPTMPGVDILWDHGSANSSKAAAAAMVEAYGIVKQPSLTSRHTAGLAIDMTISWAGSLTIKNKAGIPVVISTAPRSGMNVLLAQVGATYGVIKATFAGDPPHWSSDGH